MGNFGTPGANATVAEADVLLVVGSRLSPSDTANAHPDLINPLRQTIIQIDIEPLHASWTFPADTVIIGDARQALSALSNAIAAAGGVDQATLDARREAVLAGRRQHGYFDAPELYADVSPILPQRVIKSLATIIGEDSFVTADAGENRIFMTHFYQTKSRHGFLQGNAVAGMGYAIPAALAAKLVYPERQVVAVCSDGGYGISMNAMLTAYEEQIPIVAVILNNNALGWVKHGMGPRAVASDFADFDYAAIARSFGCGGIRVDEAGKLDGALAEALDSGVPFVVDVRTSLDEDFNRVTAPLAKATY
jgi:acetolactate synthase-1/2/3 large subunit